MLRGLPMRPTVRAVAVRALQRRWMSSHIVLESMSERVVAAERLLRRALSDANLFGPNATSACPTPLRLSEAGGTQALGVRVEVTTPPDVDAASMLSDALGGEGSWRVEAQDTAPSSSAYVAILSSSEGALKLRVPHTLEISSTPDEPMVGRPRLQSGSLTYETPRLSVAMARALASAAHSAACKRDTPFARRHDGGPLAALDKVLSALPPSDAAPIAAPDAPPVYNRAAEAASVRNAAAWPAMTLPNKSKRGQRMGGGGAMRTGGSDASRVPTTAEEAADLITELGARLILPASPGAAAGGSPALEAEGWSALAGGDEVRRAVEETLILPLRYPSAFAQVMAATRADGGRPAAARPTAMLFHGPPGTGKTAAARIASEVAALPLVCAPLESLVSKWYGEGEGRLAALFAACEFLGKPPTPKARAAGAAEGGAEGGGTGGCILFLDEIDALAGSRSREIHEASRRMLSVLLRRLDGLDAAENVAVIGATNRPSDLDAALLSRFETRVAFPPPDAAARALIFGRYARHLTEDQRGELAEKADGMSGRDILDACKNAERRWVHELVSGERMKDADARAMPPPPERLYVEGVAARREAALLLDGDAAAEEDDDEEEEEPGGGQ